MEILKESAKKDELPLDFMTSFISKGWDEIGNLKAQLEGIKQSFKGTEKVEGIMQDLIDAYLVCVGQLELHLHDNDYVEYPAVAEFVESKQPAQKAILSENIDLDLHEELPAKETIEVEEEQKKVDESVEDDNFEYFCDFDEPTLTDEDKRNYEDSLDNIR